MSLIYILILVTLIIIWLRAKVSKVNLPSVETGYSRAFLAPAVLIYAWWKKVLNQKKNGRSEVAGRSIRSRKLLSNLQTLYPGDTPDRRLDTPYRDDLDCHVDNGCWMHDMSGGIVDVRRSAGSSGRRRYLQEYVRRYECRSGSVRRGCSG